MRKLFLFLFAALMSVGMWADPTVVTWSSEDVFGSGSGTSFSKDGVTLTCREIADGVVWGSPGSVIFTNTLGNFTKIEITTGWNDQPAGWEESKVIVGWDDEEEEWKYINKLTWTGNTAIVSFSGDFGGLSSIVFTIGPGSAPEPEPEPAVSSWVRDGDEWNETTKTLTVKSNLPEDAYKDQTVIENVIISNSVTSIGNSAFYGCTGLTSVTNYALTPQEINSNVFYNVNKSSCTLNVPKGSIDLYQAAVVWQDFIFPPSWVRDGDEWNAATKTLTVNSNPGIRVYRWHDYEIEKVIISSGVTTINSDAFYRDISVTDVYCYPNAVYLTWIETECDDFKPDGSTLCHVHADQLDAYKSKFTGVVNVTFVGDLDGGSPAPAPTDEQVPTNVDPQNPSYYYSTFFHSTQNYALTNDGTTAFIADLSGNDLILTEIAEGTQVIPANTAVILRKTGSADPVVLNPTEENGVSVNPDENSLEGVDAITAVTSIDGLTTTNCYVLSGTDQYGVGFYRINSENLKAHKAYVKYSGTQNNAPRRMRFVFEQENTTTGMENVQGDNVQSTKVLENGVLYIIKNGVRYNAQGQAVK